MTDDPTLFPPPPSEPPARPPTMPSDRRIWTEHKAAFIARYVYFFIMVTKHGIYIDGFAGPQDPTKLNAWSAALVLQIEPEWLNRFVLCDNDPRQIVLLEELREKHAHRDVSVVQGDFNERVAELLIPEIVPVNSATFCLLDQRTWECEWSTVKAIADYKRETGNKIEIFYFVADWWFARAFGGIKDQATLDRVARWWGRDDWERWCCAPGIDRVRELDHRFKDELDYGFATKYAIYERERSQGHVAYYMIHATDHPRAPVLMRDAYKYAVTPIPEVFRPQLEL